MKKLISVLIISSILLSCRHYRLQHYITDYTNKIQVQVFEKRTIEMPGVLVFLYNSSKILIESGITNEKGRYTLDTPIDKVEYVILRTIGFPDIRINLKKNKKYRNKGIIYKIYWKPAKERYKDIASNTKKLREY